MLLRRHGSAVLVVGVLVLTACGDDPATTADTDTFAGRFLELVPNTRVVQTLQFESDQPDLQAEMRITVTLADVPGGTEITWLHENVPSSIRPEDNETGWRMALAKLAALAEAEARGA